MSRGQQPGRDAITAKGRFGAFKWLILRRLSQAGFLGLFLTGPLAGIWWVKGNLSSSLTFDVLPLSDPYQLLQSVFAGHSPETTGLIGAAIVLVAYAFLGGRVYCSWVCPINPVTDTAHWLRGRLGLSQKGWQPKPAARLWLLGATLVASAVTGTIAWEFVNPVSMAFRGLVFGLGAAWAIIAAVFLFDLFVSRRGWCGHLCPVGAFYGLVGAASLVRVSAPARAGCNDCMDCFAVCPEPQVITPALRGTAADGNPVVLARDCTNCGRCIDVCAKDVFRFTHRFDRRTGPAPAGSGDPSTKPDLCHDRAA